jgi:hypothetical protein
MCGCPAQGKSAARLRKPLNLPIYARMERKTLIVAAIAVTLIMLLAVAAFSLR